MAPLADISALEPESIPEYIATHPELITLDVVRELHDEVPRLVHVSVDQADRVAQAVGEIAKTLGDLPEALALRCRGHIFYARGLHAESIRAYQSALAILEPLAAEFDIGRTLASGLLPLMYLGRYDEAWAYAERAQAIYERHGDPLRLGRLAINKGNILYRQDRYGEAILLYKQGAAWFREAGGPQDIVGALSNMAVCSISLNQFDAALDYYRESRDEAGRQGLPLLAAAADYNVAYLHYLRGDYVQAIELYRASRRHCKQSGDTYHAALCDLDEAEMSLELNLNSEAESLAVRAIAAFDDLGMRYEQAKALVSLAIVHHRRGDVQRALRQFRAARALFFAEGNRYWPALIDLYRAALYREFGRRTKARELCAGAQAVLGESPLASKAVLCDLFRARLALDDGDLASSEAACRKARLRAEQICSPFLTFHANLLAGRIEELAGRPEAAWTAWQAARSEADRLRGRLWTEDLKISFLEDKTGVYENLVALGLSGALAGGSRAAEASARATFEHIQEAKSRSMADHLHLPDRPTPGLGGEEELIRQDLNWHYQQMERLALAGGDRTELERLTAKAGGFERSLLESSEARQLAEAPGLQVEEIQHSLPADSILLEYYEVRGIIHVCILDRRRLRIVPLGVSGGDVRRSIRLLQFQMSKWRLGQEYMGTWSATLLRAAESHLRELYDALIRPVATELDAEHLIVAPFGALHHLPFHALYDGVTPVMERHSVSQIPSAAVYARSRTKGRTPENRSLLLGISDARTPYLDQEIESAARYLPNPEVATGGDATTFRLSESGARARFIHIASHAVFRQDSPMFSSIRLGDGNLSLFDLYRLRFDAELVTLSGCSTGLNAVVGGDELLGLMRGLLYTGAGSLVLGLWEVNDQSTSMLMEWFYRDLASGASKPAALRSAARAVRERFPHPYYWAPFILAGNDGRS